MNKLFKIFKSKKSINKGLSTSVIAIGTTLTYLFGKQLAKLKDKMLISQDDGVIIYEIDHSNPETGVKEISLSEINEKEKADLLLTPHLKFNMKYFLTPLGYMQYLILRQNNELLLTLSSSPRQIDLMDEFMESLKNREKINNALLNTLKI